MSRIKYYYNTKTCRYEEAKPDRRRAFLVLLFFIIVIFGTSYALVRFKFFPNPNELVLQKNQQEVLAEIKFLDSQLAHLYEELYLLEHRDANIYRPILEADSLPNSLRNPGVGGSERHKDLHTSGLSQTKIKLVLDKISKVEMLKRKMYAQTQSYDDIITLAQQKEQMYASIPAVQPCDKYKRIASGFGMRIHPISGKRKMHTGLDFAAKIGTPIYSTGDGVVEVAKKSHYGYGNQVMINHGFGYKTRYAHMTRFIVKKGQKVKRGELIGYVGSTGSSTGPHLHYEVIKNRKPLNPMNFIFKDISPEDYQRILEQASEDNESM